ncbi:DNA-directed RNA polymerase I subunit rpa2 [Phytophthora boehmeriae]|uniref:DNA-directed RNA polymerase I subunit rpa2 n=1 Tax=Phytophthora boehmeriae TaxID=109152 RepID=A0A8T1X000_9STRA|nr:DNA-directed RNA polymerase I subunit rpa2 [Phytophthora boehmeriae]
MNYGGGYEAYGADDYSSNGGGGFMSSQPSGSQSAPSKRSGGAQSILPVTIKQLQSLGSASDDDGLRLDGQEVSIVRLVGLLTSLSPHSTSLRFQLDDGSGAFDCQYFVNADDEAANEAELNRLREGAYVRVVGKLRSFQGKSSLSCFSVAPVEDLNELTHHFLDVIYVHCYNTKGPLNKGAADVTMTSFNTPTKTEGGWNQPSAAGGFAGGALDYGMDANFSPEQKAILDVLGTCTSDRGLKIDQIFADLRGQITEQQLRNALNYLTSEGHVYSTIDEDHFKRTA